MVFAPEAQGGDMFGIALVAISRGMTAGLLVGSAVADAVLVDPPLLEVRMLGFLRSPPHRDADLGEFTRKSGRWRGRVVIPPHGDVELRVAGGRSSPDAASMEMARSLAVTYQALQTEITRALFEHYQPGWEAWTSGELEGMVDSFPEITSARDVWSHVQVQHVDIDAARADFPVEVRIDAAWDDEHTLGVRLRDGRVVELCGSVGP